MHVHVEPAGDHVPAGRVHHKGAALVGRGQARSHRGNRLATNRHVATGLSLGAKDHTIGDDHIIVHEDSPRGVAHSS